ncbi:LemA family protein [Pedobacter yulinensis]|uniref:LemA family protein n=1 Tax=Pedobacter yulinensis TaxID=2126353 RepID=A0A2T3HR11_9SPHI|nr:LemA family protein [Pedobacter yulinensis]PST84900.1 LemA family protein [Pedobacter yulinensis]
MILPLVIAAILIFALIGFYNSVVRKKNQVTNAFSAIDVMLQKRFDLIPNLVETVKAYARYESSTLEKITGLRSKAMAGTTGPAEKAALDQQIGTAVKSIIVNSENYPELKANSNFQNLQITWTESEEQTAAARRHYNSAVTDYNNGIMTFPGNVLAGILNYTPLPVLAVAEAERQAPNAKALFNN